MIDLELVRGNGKIKVYDLGFGVLYDEKKLLLEVEYNKIGRTNQIDIIKAVINHIYENIVNPKRKLFGSIKGKYTRASNYLANNYSEDMSIKKKDKYLSKISETKAEMNRLEAEFEFYKHIVRDLYQLFPEHYSRKSYIKKLQRDREFLVQKLKYLDIHIESLETA